MQHSSGGLGGGLVIAILIVIAIMVRRGRMTSRRGLLNKGERVRPLAITLLDPVISVVVIGSVFWRLASFDGSHAALAVLGGAVGIVIGWARARVMFVRAIPDARNVVLRRSPMEYGLLALLIVLRVVEGDLKRRTGVEALALTALVSLALLESMARSGFIVEKYLRAKRLPAGTTGGPF